jgi:DNA-binding NarL/FixJ family response regulator
MERVLIVDDHPLVRDGLRSVIAVTFDGCDIFEAASLEEALSTLETQDNFDLILLDLNIPDVKRLDGLKLLRSVSHAAGRDGVGRLRPDRGARGAGRGGGGFHPKSMKRSAILDACTAWWRARSARRHRGSRPAAQQNEQIRERIESLTPQQKIVLNHLVHGRLNKQIAHDLSVSMTTVKAHVSAILLKLNVFSRTQAVILANRVQFDGD